MDVHRLISPPSLQLLLPFSRGLCLSQLRESDDEVEEEGEEGRCTNKLGIELLISPIASSNDLRSSISYISCMEKLIGWFILFDVDVDGILEAGSLLIRMKCKQGCYYL